MMSARKPSWFSFVLQDIVPPEARFSERVRCLRQIVLVKNIAVVQFRLSQALGERLSLLGYAVKQLNHIVTGADLAWQASVGPGLVLHHPTGVVWGPGVVLGRDVVIQQGVTLGGRGGSGLDGSPSVGDRTEIGAGARVLGPIVVGSDCKIGANAVVLRDVPSGCAAVGIPARVVGDDQRNFT